LIVTNWLLKVNNQVASIQGLIAAYTLAIRSAVTEDHRSSRHVVFICKLPFPYDSDIGSPGDVCITEDNIQVKNLEGWTAWVRSHFAGQSIRHLSMENRILEYRTQINMVTYAPWNTVSNWQQEWDQHGVSELLNDWGRICNLTDKIHESLKGVIGSSKTGYRKLKVPEIARMIFLCYGGETSAQVRLSFPSSAN
jgi:hypothetical protein